MACVGRRVAQAPRPSLDDRRSLAGRAGRASAAGRGRRSRSAGGAGCRRARPRWRRGPARAGRRGSSPSARTGPSPWSPRTRPACAASGRAPRPSLRGSSRQHRQAARRAPPASPCHPGAQDPLGCALRRRALRHRVHLGAVEEVDAALRRGVQQPRRLCLRRALPEQHGACRDGRAGGHAQLRQWHCRLVNINMYKRDACCTASSAPRHSRDVCMPSSARLARSAWRLNWPLRALSCVGSWRRRGPTDKPLRGPLLSA